jgi:hypothetical protein
MVHVGETSLRQSFHAHRGVADDGQQPSHYLLLFYAAECALKLTYLRRNRLRTTDCIRDPTLLTEAGHDLPRWLKELRAPASITGGVHHFRPAKEGSAMGVAHAHQAWRYGYRMNAEDEQQLVKWLRSVCDWAEEA